jgi:subtilisin
MKHPFIASFLAFALFLTTPASAFAASSGSLNRYFVPSTRSFWRNAFAARHVFSDGFTADLSDLQLRLAKFAGLKPIAVKKFNILEDESTSPSVSPEPTVIPSQGVSWGVRAMLGNDTLKKTSGGEGITVAVLDTGVDVEHPDLKNRIDGCFDLADPSNGFIKDSCKDTDGHGTHVAGIIAADGGPEGNGLYGFAPQASISAYRVCGSAGVCLSDDIAVAIRDAVDRGAQIIALGLGGEAESSFIDDALQYAQDHGVLVVAAAGNDGPYDDSIDWPGRDVRAISVGAIDNEQMPADFSSRGTNEDTKAYQRNIGDIEFSAPGVNIESTFNDGGYAILSGTSMAVPHVAGLAALIWQSDNEHPAQATRAKLRKLSVDIGEAGDDNATGWGMPVLPTK